MVKKMVHDLVKKAPKIPTWVLAQFNDPVVKLVKTTSDVDELESSLNSLKYGGGSDLKEQCLKGVSNDILSYVKCQMSTKLNFCRSVAPELRR